MDYNFESLEKKVDDIRKILLGNGNIGLIAKVQMLWEGKKTRMGLLDWCFRLAIAIALGYIATQVGLK